MPVKKWGEKKLSHQDGVRLALLLVIILGLLCIGLKMRNNEVVQTLESSYSRALYELVEYLDNVETLLAKAQISYSSEYAAKNLTEIWRKADLAQSSLSQIPITHMTLEKTEQFLNQLSDYSYSLSHHAMEGEMLSEEAFQNLKNFYARCQILNQTIQSLALDMGNGSLSWAELTKEQEREPLAQEVANISQDSFGMIEENMQDYEGLIYDGPFSEHMTSSTPLGLGDEMFDEAKAREVAQPFFQELNAQNMVYQGVTNGNIPVHRFEAELLGGEMSKVYADITVQGGKLLWFLIAQENGKAEDMVVPIGEERLSFEEAREIALNFLEVHGIPNMKETYYITENGIATINFAYVEKETNLGEIVCYPDLVKVKVSMINGSVLGMEAQSYYASHHERKIALPQITLEEARAKLNPRLSILSEGIAVIPTDFKTELTTYELKGKVDDNEFIVYVNVETGKEEKIFMIIDTPNGVLTI